jgi:hypothetical protein
MSRKIFTAVLCVLAAMSVSAQQAPTRTKEKKEKEEITIKKKNGSSEKMTIRLSMATGLHGERKAPCRLQWRRIVIRSDTEMNSEWKWTCKKCKGIWPKWKGRCKEVCSHS